MSPRIRTLPLTALAALAFPGVAAGEPVCAGAANGVTKAQVAAARASVVCLVNAERRANGLRPLKVNRRLGFAASVHAADMTRRRYFAHTSLDGTTMLTRLTRVGYARPWIRYIVGENVGWGNGALSSPAVVVTRWLRGARHRANLLRPGFREVGVGISSASPFGGSGATYTIDFGALG